MRCPLHGGTNPSAFSFDRARWHCFAGCGGGDVLELAQRLFDVDFRDGLEHCAALVGIRPAYRTAASVRRALELRQRAAADRAVEEERHRRLFEYALEGVRAAQVDADLLRILYRLDPEQTSPSTAAILDELGDPYLLEIAAHDRLDKVERDWRAAARGRGAR